MHIISQQKHIICNKGAYELISVKIFCFFIKDDFFFCTSILQWNYKDDTKLCIIIANKECNIILHVEALTQIKKNSYLVMSTLAFVEIKVCVAKSFR